MAINDPGATGVAPTQSKHSNAEADDTIVASVMPLSPRIFCAFVVVAFSCCMSGPASASQGCLSTDQRAEIAAAAGKAESGAFHRALRQAVAADPSCRREVLHHAMLQQPDWTANLLVTALFDPPLNSADTSPPSLAQTAAAPSSEGRETRRVEIGPGQVEVGQGEIGQTDAVEPKSPWSGTLDIGGVARSGNTTNLGVSAGIEVIYEAAPWRHAGELSFDYLEASGTTEAQVLDAEYQLHYDLTEKTFVYGLTHYEDDRFSGFEYEITASGGLGTRLIENEILEWTVAAGPSLRVFREKDDDEVETAPGIRLNNDVAWQISETAKLANETEVRLDRERSEVENETSLTLQIIESLAGKFSFVANYRSPVPEDTDELDTTTKASLIYGF